MTKEEFEKRYAKNSNCSIEYLNGNGLFAVKCDCGENGCNGWKMTTEKLEKLNECMYNNKRKI